MNAGYVVEQCRQNLIREQRMPIENAGSFTSVLSLNRDASLTSQFSGKSSSSSLFPAPRGSISSHKLLGNSSQVVRRSGCRKCVHCTKVSKYYHSDASRTRPNDRGERNWWPGNIHSPVIYFTLRIRQLEHQARTVPRTSKIWRQKTENLVRDSERIGMRRGLSLSPLLIPITHTNVSYRCPPIKLIGVKTLHVSRVPEESVFTTGDSKRRCMSWEREDASSDARAIMPSPFVSQGFQKPIYSGTVVDKNPFAERMNILDHSKQIVLHESPDSTLAATKAISTGTTKDSLVTSVDNDSFMMPVLKSQASANIDDPTMQGYYDKQYAIKKEQAFHCHHAIDISEVAGVQKQDGGLWDYLKSITNFGR